MKISTKEDLKRWMKGEIESTRISEIQLTSLTKKAQSKIGTGYSSLFFHKLKECSSLQIFRAVRCDFTKPLCFNTHVLKRVSLIYCSGSVGEMDTSHLEYLCMWDSSDFNSLLSRKMPLLQVLDVSGNDLRRFPGRMAFLFPSLKEFDISWNMEIEFPSVFSHPTIRDLNLEPYQFNDGRKITLKLPNLREITVVDSMDYNIVSNHNVKVKHT